MIRLKNFIFIAVMLVVSSVSSEELSITSWNIKTIEVKKVYQVEEWNKRLPFQADYIEWMNSDIIGMQEATLIQIDSLLNRMPQYRYVGLASRDGKKSGNYNPIFYKPEVLNLMESKTFWLSETPNKPSMGWDANCKRICTWALFQEKSSGKIFAVFNTHLDHIGDIAKINEIEQVLDSLSNRLDKPVFLMGDLNSEKGSEVLNRIEQRRVLWDSRDVAKKKLAFGGTFNAFDLSKEPQKVIDFVFVNDSIEVLHYSILNDIYWNAGKKHYYSDHFPICLRVVLK